MSWLRAIALSLLVACSQTERERAVAQPDGSGGSGGSGTHRGGNASSRGGSSQAGGPGSAGSDVDAGAGGMPAQGEAGSGGEPEAAAGASSELVDCDPKKVACEIAPPECPLFEVPMVQGTCYGPCVDIQRCACDSQDDCPVGEPDGQYPCWGAMHCGPLL